jgi:hypothetical protein
MDEDHAERDVAVLLPDELVRVLAGLQVLETDDLSHPAMVVAEVSLVPEA